GPGAHRLLLRDLASRPADRSGAPVHRHGPEVQHPDRWGERERSPSALDRPPGGSGVVPREQIPRTEGLHEALVSGPGPVGAVVHPAVFLRGRGRRHDPRGLRGHDVVYAAVRRRARGRGMKSSTRDHVVAATHFVLGPSNFIVLRLPENWDLRLGRMPMDIDYTVFVDGVRWAQAGQASALLVDAKARRAIELTVRTARESVSPPKFVDAKSGNCRVARREALRSPVRSLRSHGGPGPPRGYPGRASRGFGGPERHRRTRGVADGRPP